MAGDTDTGPLVASIDQFGSQCRLRVLEELQHGELSRQRLQRSVTAGSEPLSDALAALEEFGFVTGRTEAMELLDTDYRCSQELTGTMPEDTGTPVTTYYALTPKGAALEPVFETVEAWADDWLDDRPDRPAANG